MGHLDYEKEHARKIYRGLAECTVLLKTSGDFPLGGPCNIACYGNGVRKTIRGGTGSGEVNCRKSYTIEEGLQRAGFYVTTRQWLDDYDEVHEQAHKQFLKELKSEARHGGMMAMMSAMGSYMLEPEYELELNGKGNVAIYVVSRNSGEGSDRTFEKGDACLTDTEIRDIHVLSQKYDKFMLVLNVGAPIDLSPVMDVQDILLLSQLGAYTGVVLADILLGRVSPSGKLTTTWASQKTYPKLPMGDRDDTPYEEGIYVGYRYFDAFNEEPLFPFGHGLSYTTFTRNYLQLHAEGSKITLKAEIHNVGEREGKEVLQVYLSAPQGKLTKCYQELVGFVKTKTLASGETDTVEVTFDLRDSASYDEDTAAYLLEKGLYKIRAGFSSRDTELIGALELTEDVVVRKVKNCGGNISFTQWKAPEREDTEEIPTIMKIAAANICCEEVDYTRDETVEYAIAALKDEDLAYMNVGSFNPKGGLLSIVGNASSKVCGAAGETTNFLDGVDSLAMADGPAGLRLTRDFYRDKKGVHALGQAMMPDSMLELMPAPIRVVLSGPVRPKRGCEVEHQYATSLPIATALAQSFNLAYAQACGDVVGEEMIRFGVQLWLAPALNIHRSVLCGRNFEYYSEDPLISGLMAAAVTRGVQAHECCGTTIKHYAANNQEYNRYNNNSQISERALREIYLKGFGLCVRESQPMAVMTSYNLLNGQHTSEREDLIEDILRAEYGFKGIVMTDWIIMGGTFDKTSVHPAPQAKLVAKGGGDIVMPGSQGDYESILDGLESGELSRHQLEVNASRLYRMIRKLSK